MKMTAGHTPRPTSEEARLYGNTHNPTWDVYDTSYWSAVELNVAVCCACMPNIRLLLVKLFPKQMGSSAGAEAATTRLESRTRNNGHDPSDPTLTITRSRAFHLKGFSLNSGKQSSTFQLVEMDGADSISKHSKSSNWYP
ncbi:hypothetical protein GE09DRAFT_1165163 [Coniochaeta sp. 2T2.1]|nr:hypothetical protein GE09DRAFT_1165163 [Coniochaeta sp. 2T2.1]